MSEWIGNCYLETGYGFNPDTSTVIQYEFEDGRAVNGKCVFRGKWEDCVKYAKDLKEGR